MELNTTRERLRQDHLANNFYELLEANQDTLNLRDARFYHDFPLYRDNEQIIISKIILVAPSYGAFVVGTSGASEFIEAKDIDDIEADLDATFGHVHSRLTKQRALRRDKKNLAFNLEAFIFAPHLEGQLPFKESESPIVRGLPDLKKLLDGFLNSTIPETMVAEICSVIEGAKGLAPSKKRDLAGRVVTSRVSLVAALEAEIRSFDQDQKNGYLTLLEGPQRIRGLAGSGKTVVLAMKAAQTHLRDPEAKILFTFYTRSLYQHVRRLITRFYRQYDDRDPNWENIKVLHAWGG